MDRKSFLRLSSAGAISAIGTPLFLQACASPGDRSAAGGSDAASGMFFKISLAQWSLHKAFFGESITRGWEYMGRMLETDPAGVLQGSIRPVDFPRIAKLDHGIDAVEYVSLFYPGTTGGDSPVIKQLRETADAEGVRSVLIMVDREGALGDPDTQARARAVSNHHKWVDAAAYLGCHSIRVNAESQGTWDEQRDRAADGLAKLSEYAAGQSINVIVENHGGLSSNGEWLSSVIRQVGMDNCGTLPDFGNFKVSETERYDTYLGVEQLMPFAKGVSAKSYDFDAEGNETTLDYRRLLAIVRDAGYTGYVGVEYEGSRLSEPDGIAATRNLLLTIGAEMDA